MSIPKELPTGSKYNCLEPDSLYQVGCALLKMARTAAQRAKE